MFALKPLLFEDSWTGVLKFMMDTEEGGSFFAGAIIDLFTLACEDGVADRRILQRISEIMAYSNRLPDRKYHAIATVLRRAWPPRSSQEAVGLRHLPMESFGDLVHYDWVRELGGVERAFITTLICSHVDTRMRTQLQSGYLHDTNPGVALTINRSRSVKLKEHNGLWAAIGSRINQKSPVDIVCDDVSALVSGWDTVTFFIDSQLRRTSSLVGVIVDEFTKNLEELKRGSFIKNIIVESDSEDLAADVRGFSGMYAPPVELAKTTSAKVR